MPSPNYSRLPVVISVAALLCALVATLVWHFTVPPPSSAPFPSVSKARPKPSQAAKAAAPVVQTSSKRDPRSIDPDIQRLADDLASKEQSPIRDLEIVNEFITLYSKAFQGNPIGMNEDITAVLTGHNYTKGILFPPNSPMIVKGQIVDRWGSPYWFHPSSSTQMEIRSPGPDKNLFTGDDIVINPGPEHFGAVTQAQ
jgi:hypothetical protein